MNNKSLRSVLVSLVLFTILAMVILIPAQADADDIKISIKPSSTIVNSTDDVYSATMEPKSDAPSGGFYFLNVTIPARYNFTLPAAGKTVGNYTMFNKTADKNQIIINITSNNPTTETVDVNYSTDYGLTYSTSTDHPITNIVIGDSNLKITKPTFTTPGYLNLSLGGTAGPIKRHNKVNIKLANYILKNPNTTGDYVWYLEAKNNLTVTGTPYTDYDVVKIKNGSSKVVVKPILDANNPAEANLSLPSGDLKVKITTPHGVNVTDLVITLRNFTEDPIDKKTGVESLLRFMFIGIDAPALSDVSFNATITVNYSSALPLTIPEANLRLYRFNDSNDAWEPTIHCGVDIVNKTVCGNTTGFSTFAVMGATPSQPSSDGSGSSTGGGGVTTSEPIQNIVKHETRDCNVLSAKPSSCKFSVPEHWVSELVVTGKENELVTFRIEALKGLSSKVPVPAPGTQYLNIWPGSKRIQEALIRFRIENSWIVSEGLTSENLRMYRWDGTKWNELETRVLSKDASATNFEAKTDGFTYFAITGVKTAAPQVAMTTAAPTATAPGGKPSATAIAPPVAQQPISLVYIIILIGVIAVVAYLYAQTRKKK